VTEFDDHATTVGWESMRLERPTRHERFGAVRIHDVTQVIELESGSGVLEDMSIGGREVAHVPDDLLRATQAGMVIVIPTKNERRKVIDGVLSGIPHPCRIILVSASERDPIDRFELESELLGDFCDVTGRAAVAIHQFDPGLAAALSSTGLGAIVDRGSVRPGKGEAMVTALLLADAMGARSVGFVDADNYMPGAIHEYVTCFAAGLTMARSPYAMVRISWHSKPKVENGRLVFNRWGRSTTVTNRFLNLVLATYTGFGTDVIKTANAGDHAMTMDLARRLRFAGGFAVEPYELIEMFDQYGGAFPSPHPEVNRSAVDVFQIETRNPHLHEDKGIDHVDEMLEQALRVLYRSRLCPDAVRDEILEFLGGDRPGEDVSSQRPAVYPSIDQADTGAFISALANAPTFTSFGPDPLAVPES
jgi:mannosyl-3-phosphoglycerate synthase